MAHLPEHPPSAVVGCDRMMSKEVYMEVTANRFEVVGDNVQASKREERLARKREAARRYKEKAEQEKALCIANAKKFIERMKADGLWDKLDDESRAFVEGIAQPAATVNRQSTFAVLFGESPKVGDSITLGDAFQKTLKGKATLDAYFSRWAAKGVVVTFSRAENVMESTYTIEALAMPVSEGTDID